jgi:hypothetical protein
MNSVQKSIGSYKTQSYGYKIKIIRQRSGSMPPHYYSFSHASFGLVYNLDSFAPKRILQGVL